MLMESDDSVVTSCRICGTANQDGEFERLIEDDGGLSAAGKLYEELFGFNIDADSLSDWPQYLCNSCDLQMRLFKKLKSKATKTLAALRQRIDRSNGIVSTKLYDCYDTIGYLSGYGEAQQCVTEVLDLNKAHHVVNTHEEDEEDNDGISRIDMGYQKAPDDNDEALYEKEVTFLLSPNKEKDLSDPDSADITVFLHNINEEEKTTTISRSSTEVEWNATNDLEYKTIACAECSETDWETEEAYRAHLKQHLPHFGDKYDLTDEFNKEEGALLTVQTFDGDTVGDFNTENLNNYDVGVDVGCLKRNEDQALLPLAQLQSEYENESDSGDGTANCTIEYLEDSDECEHVDNLPEPKQKAPRQRSMVCTICSGEFANYADLILHRKAMHSNKYQCHECGRELKTLHALRMHMKLHEGQPDYKCDKCGRTFNQKVHYNYHMDMHNNVRKFKCDKCSKAFLSKSDLATHIRLHSGKRPHICDICDKAFLLTQHLKMHRYSHFEKTFQCALCKQMFISPSTLRTHIKSIHASQPEFSCDLCTKKFRRKHHLVLHYKMHERVQCDRIEAVLEHDDHSQNDAIEFEIC